jgi:hypothetical protein
MNVTQLQAALDRCDREIAEIRQRPDVQAGTAPAWLVTLGIEDWECEKRLLMERHGHLVTTGVS